MASKIKKSKKPSSTSKVMKAKPVKQAAVAAKVNKETKAVAAPKRAATAKGGSDGLALIGMKAPTFTMPDQDGTPVSHRP